MPKGPSLDPADKRMAVHVEDHPLAYATFEGVIPPGQYGAGTVIVWDRGLWIPDGDPREGYRQGKLKFELQGEKLQGRWTLVRMRGRGNERQEPWLLIKERDEAARPAAEYDITEALPDSVNANNGATAAAKPARQQHAPKKTSKKRSADAVALPDGARPAKSAACPRAATCNACRLPRPLEATGSMRSSLTVIACSPASTAATSDCSRAAAMTGRRGSSTWRKHGRTEASERLDRRRDRDRVDGQGRTDFQALQNAFDAVHDCGYSLPGVSTFLTTPITICVRFRCESAAICCGS